MARRALQKYYGYVVDDPKSDDVRAAFASTVVDRKHPIFNGGVVYDGLGVQNYCEFAVVVELREHAYNGPYTLKLYHQLDKNDPASPKVFLGRVDVFTRPDHSACAGCSRRRAAGTIVRGTIFIDISVVDRIAEKHDLNREDATVEELIDKVKESLIAELTNPRGERLAAAEGEADVLTGGRTVRREPPARLTLLTSQISHVGYSSGPLKVNNWNDRGGIFRVRYLPWNLNVRLRAFAYYDSSGRRGVDDTQLACHRPQC